MTALLRVLVIDHGRLHFDGALAGRVLRLGRVVDSSVEEVPVEEIIRTDFHLLSGIFSPGGAKKYPTEKIKYHAAAGDWRLGMIRCEQTTYKRVQILIPREVVQSQ